MEKNNNAKRNAGVEDKWENISFISYFFMGPASYKPGVFFACYYFLLFSVPPSQRTASCLSYPFFPSTVNESLLFIWYTTTWEKKTTTFLALQLDTW